MFFQEEMGMMTSLLTFCVGYGLSVGMTYIAFTPHALGILLRQSTVVWAGGALLGGIMSWIVSLGTPFYMEYGKSYTLSFAVCTAISFFLIRMISGAMQKKKVTVKIKQGTETCSISAMCDSGCQVAEPISGIPVIIVSERKLGMIGQRLKGDNVADIKLRLIPITGIGGSRMLRGFLPDKVYVDSTEVKAVIASDPENKDYSGYEGIVPSILCNKI